MGGKCPRCGSYESKPWKKQKLKTPYTQGQQIDLTGNPWEAPPKPEKKK